MSSKIRLAEQLWRACGLRGGLLVVRDRLAHARPNISEDVLRRLQGGSVLEIGGPSSFFAEQGRLPIYGVVARADNMNYAGATLWESNLKDGGVYAPDGRPLGIQNLLEATAVDVRGRYDGVISSHTIEHVANPLRALKAWRRATRPEGYLVLVVPHRDGTFDHRRPITPLEHLLEDEATEMPESDQTHAPEILSLHDLRRDPGVAGLGDLRQRVENNERTRAMHHHVFDTQSALAMIVASGWRPMAVEAMWPHDIVVFAEAGETHTASPTVRSPFRSDR